MPSRREKHPDAPVHPSPISNHYNGLAGSVMAIVGSFIHSSGGHDGPARQLPLTSGGVTSSRCLHGDC